MTWSILFFFKFSLPTAKELLDLSEIIQHFGLFSNRTFLDFAWIYPTLAIAAFQQKLIQRQTDHSDDRSGENNMKFFKTTVIYKKLFFSLVDYDCLRQNKSDAKGHL